MKANLRESFTKLIAKEIDWCLKHPATNLPKPFQDGFVAGLEQAKRLILGEVKGGGKDAVSI